MASLVVLALFPSSHCQKQSRPYNGAISRRRIAGEQGDGLFEALCRSFVVARAVVRYSQQAKINIGCAARIVGSKFLGLLDQNFRIVDRVGSQATGPNVT